jgi:hypothetical protein
MDAIRKAQELENPHWRHVLLVLLGAQTHDQIRAGLQALSEGIGFRATLAREFEVSPRDATQILEIVMSTELPVLVNPGYTAQQIIEWFWTRPDPALLPAIARHYAVAPPRLQAGALGVLAMIGSPAAMVLARDLLNEHGVPSGMYYRFFKELGKRLEVSAPVLPDLIAPVTKDRQFLPMLMNVINEAIESGRLDTAALVPHRACAERATEELLGEARRLLRSPGDRPPEYADIRTWLGACLDLLARVSDTSLSSLREAQTFEDPYIAMMASVVLLRHGVESPESAWRAIAASDECREPLYEFLKASRRLDLFPPEHVTVEAFAASDMVRWLSYPAELGHAPERLEKMARLSGATDDGEQVYFLWRISDGGKRYAGVSGPYPADAEPGPLYGGSTFSHFEDWDSATPEAHFMSITETLSRWSVEMCKS